MDITLPNFCRQSISMDWFQGSVSEAIGVAKQCGGLIAFQVVDGGELSSATTAAWAAPSVRSCFTNSTFGMFLTLIRVATYSLWSPSFTQSTEHAAFPVPLRWYSIFVHPQITCQYVYTFFLTYSIFYINILLLFALCSFHVTKVCSAAVSMEGFVPMLLQSGSKDSTDFSAFRKTIIISSHFIFKIF